MMDSKSIFEYGCVAVFLLFLGLLFFVDNKRDDANIETDNVVRDTVEVVIHDTIRETQTRYVTERIIDTVMVSISDTIYMPVIISQRVYEGENYRAWVSGFRPSLDSIDVFTTTKYITATETREVVVHKTHLYGYGKIFIGDGITGIGAGGVLTIKDRWMLSGGVHYVNRIVGGDVGVGYAIF